MRIHTVVLLASATAGRPGGGRRAAQAASAEGWALIRQPSTATRGQGGAPTVP